MEIILLYQNVTQLVSVYFPAAANIKRLGHRKVSNQHLMGKKEDRLIEIIAYNASSGNSCSSNHKIKRRKTMGLQWILRTNK